MAVKKSTVDAQGFENFCIDLGIWEKRDGQIYVKPGPMRHTQKEIERLYKEQIKRKAKDNKKR